MLLQGKQKNYRKIYGIVIDLNPLKLQTPTQKPQ